MGSRQRVASNEQEQCSEKKERKGIWVKGEYECQRERGRGEDDVEREVGMEENERASRLVDRDERMVG